MRALLVGTPGRSPFTGHFRGRVVSGGAALTWAGRLRWASTPEEGWAAAEVARDALAGVTGADRFALVDAAWAALRSVEHEDLSVILVANDADGVVVAASGLAEVRVDGKQVAEAAHPLYDEPGIRERTGYFHPDVVGEDWVGVPVGGKWPKEPVLAACGVRGPG